MVMIPSKYAMSEIGSGEGISTGKSAQDTLNPRRMQGRDIVSRFFASTVGFEEEVLQRLVENQENMDKWQIQR